MTELPLLDKFKLPEVLRVQANYRRRNHKPNSDQVVILVFLKMMRVASLKR
jgi:hypothetical protein